MNKTKNLILLITIVVISSLVISPEHTQGLPVGAEVVLDDSVAREIDQASFQQLQLLGSPADFPRTGEEVENNLKALVNQFPSEPRYLRALAEAQVDNSKFAEAAANMEKIAAIHPDKAKGLRELVSYYASRIEPEKQIAALRRLADLKEGKEKIAVLREILEVNNNYLLQTVSKETVLREMIVIEPDQPAHVTALINELIVKDKLEEALKEAEAAIAKFPAQKNNLTSSKAEIFWKKKQPENALALYDVELDIVSDLPVIKSYLNLLDRMGKRKEVVRELQKKQRLNTLSRKEFQKYILVMRDQRDVASLLKGVEQFINNNKPLGLADQHSLALVLKSTGHFDIAWKLLYGCYLKAPAPEKEKINYELVSWSAELGSKNTNLPSIDSSLIFSNSRFDVTPGIQGGLLSLLFNKQDLSWRFGDLKKTSGSYEDAKIHYSLFKDFVAAYPKSDYLPFLYSGVIASLNSYGRYHESLKYAEEFMNNYIESDNYYIVAESAIVSLQNLKQTSKIEKLYKELLSRADSRKETEAYSKYLSKLESFYTSSKQLPKMVALYWQQITAHPDDESLYTRFVRFLNNYKIYAEELKVYKQAAARFNSNSYYDKMARWYIRQNQKEQFQELTRKIADIFSDSELKEYLWTHLRGASNSNNTNHPDNLFYQAMYEYANKRFPRNLDFVDRLLSHYQGHSELHGKYETLAKQYFYASGKIRSNFLRYLSKNNKLESGITAIKGGGELSRSLVLKMMVNKTPRNLAEALVQKYTQPDADKAAGTDVKADPVEKLFLAEAAAWNSYYEAAMPLYVELSRSYPQMQELVGKSASLYRSMGELKEARETYEILATQEPGNKEYPTLAGEVAMESGNFPVASRNWNKIIQSAPAQPDRYLEVATILWDYYRFGESAQVIEQGRNALNQPGLFGNKLAAVYESNKDYPRAIDEYILTIVRNWDNYYERYSSEDRLIYLAKERGRKDEVINRYQALFDKDAGNPAFIKAYYDFLGKVDENGQASALLESSISRYQDSETINWLAVQFRNTRKFDSERRCWEQIIKVDGENTDNLLALAQFYERQGQLVQAEAVFEKRINLTLTDQPEAMPDYIVAIDEAANFSWRHDDLEKAFMRFEKAARLKSEYSQRASLHDLAKKMIILERYTKATAIIRELLEKDPLSSEYFESLASMYTRQEDYPGLTEIFRERLNIVKNDKNLDRESRIFRMNQLRGKLIINLEKLGDYTNALDQYIEMINGDFQNANYLDNAYLMASNHGLSERLLNYYLNTSEKSFKDHRWNYVLARLYERQNRIPLAIEQWQKAIVNEPQKISLRDALAKNLVNQKKYNEAVLQYQEIYRLDERNSAWLWTIASVQAMNDDLAAAHKTLDQILAESPLNYQTYFRVAEYLSGWGDEGLALTRMEEGLAVLKKDIYENRLTKERIDQYTKLALKLGKVTETFEALLALNQVYTTEANKEMNAQAWIARDGQNLTFQIFADRFASEIREYASETSLTNMKARLLSILDANLATFKSSNDSGQAANIRWAGDVAREIGFDDLALKALTEVVFVTRGEDTYSLFASLRNTWNWGKALELVPKINSANWNYSTSSFVQMGSNLVRTFKSEEEELVYLKKYSWYVLRAAGREQLERYLTLLDKAGDKAGLEEAATYCDAADWFIEKGYTDLALKSLGCNQNLVWQDSKKLIIGYLHNRAEAELGMSQSSADLMQNIPIGRRLGVNSDNIIKGDDYYGYLPHYANYLAKFGPEGEFDKFISGLSEGSPRSALQQKRAGDWYTQHSKWEKATYHYNLALQLAPGNFEVLLAIGDLELKKGNKAAALEKWKLLIPEKAGAGNYQQWLHALWERGFEAEAIAGVHNYLLNLSGDDFSWQDRDLLSSFAYLMFENELPEKVAALAAGFVESKSKPMNFLLPMYQDIEETPQVKIAVLEQMIKIQKVDGANSDNLKNWLEEAISYSSDYPEYAKVTLEWCSLYEAGGFQENPSYRIGEKRDYQFLKGKALVEKKMVKEGLQALQLYLEPDSYDERDRAKRIYQILKDNGFSSEANTFILAFLKTKITDGATDDELLFDYADYLLQAGGDSAVEGAVGYLERIIFSGNNASTTLTRAAAILEKNDQRAAALPFRVKLADLVPENNSNNINIALTLFRTGEKERAADLALKAINEKAGVSLVVQWGTAYAEILAATPEKGRKEIARLKALTDKMESSEILIFHLTKALGEKTAAADYAENSFKTMVKPDILALKLGQFFLDENKFENSLRYGYLSRRIYPSPENGQLIIDSLRKLGRGKELLMLITADDYWNLSDPDSERISTSSTLTGEARLRFIEELYSIAVEQEQIYQAEGYLRMVKDLARELGVRPRVDSKPLKLLRKKVAIRSSRFKLTESLANSMGEE